MMEKKAAKEKKKQTGRKALLPALLCVLFLGIVLELFCNYPAIRERQRGNSEVTEISLQEISREGFEERDGKLFLAVDSGFLHIPLDGGYVGKFCYSYEYDGLLNATVRVGYRNIYGEVRERDARMTEDRNPKVLKTSWIPVNGRAEYVDISVTRESLREAGLSYVNFDLLPLTFSSFAAVTVPAVNWYRLCFFWCTAGLLVGLLFFREYLTARMEVGFLVVSLAVGTLFSLSLPANKVSWDEEVHFSQVFWMANYRTPVPVSPAILQEFSAGIDTWPYNQPQSAEELAALNAYLDAEGDYRNGEHAWSVDLNKTTMTGYVTQALCVKAGSLLQLPFSVVYRLGRLGNLFLYCIVMFLAIRKTPVGKGILTFLGLAPEPMLLAGVYSYDPTVTAFLSLSLAWILWVLLTPEKKMTWKDYAVILLSFFWGCRIKAVYAPLLLLGLLIPKEKYRSRRERILMRAGMVLLCLLLMLSFVLPVVLAPRDIGDIRGENTSEKGQMAYILGQPLAYAWVLFTNVFRTFPSYVLGEQSLGLLGHQGTFSFPWMLYAGSAAVILTDGYSVCGKHLNGIQKLWIFLLSGAAAVLVWTSMYIAFTTPGNTYIDGVQGRYYLPFLFPVWLVFHPSRVRVDWKEKDYHALVLGLSGTILLTAYAVHVLGRFCL